MFSVVTTSITPSCRKPSGECTPQRLIQYEAGLQVPASGRDLFAVRTVTEALIWAPRNRSLPPRGPSRVCPVRGSAIRLDYVASHTLQGEIAAMADGRHSPLEGLLPWALPGGEVALAELRFAEQIGVRVRQPVAAYLAGVPLPLEPNRVASMRRVRTLWFGPDEWLVTAPEGAAPDLMGRITRALASRQAAVSDLSTSRAIIEISGPRSRALLEKGCGLDLH